MSRDAPDFDALQEFLRSDAFEFERDRVDEQTYSPVTETFTKQRRAYAEQYEYGVSSVMTGKLHSTLNQHSGLCLQIRVQHWMIGSLSILTA